MNNQITPAKDQVKFPISLIVKLAKQTIISMFQIISKRFSRNIFSVLTNYYSNEDWFMIKLLWNR